MFQKKIVNFSGTAVTIGTFDGVHCGHQLVVETLLKEACERGLMARIITFDPHPLEIVAPDRSPLLIEMPERRLEIIRELGVSPELIAFTEDVRRMTAREWIRLLVERYDARFLLLGYDNRFGSDGRMLSFEDYVSLGKEVGLEVVKAPEVKGVSSSRVREAILQGDMRKAAELLGRPFEVRGKVIEGRKQGRKLGFPTANLRISSKLILPPDGVYAAKAILRIEGVEQKYDAVVSIGNAPTLTDGTIDYFEVYIVGFSGDIYGNDLEVKLIEKMRNQEVFPSLESLISQIRSDVENSIRITENY